MERKDICKQLKLDPSPELQAAYDAMMDAEEAKVAAGAKFVETLKAVRAKLPAEKRLIFAARARCVCGQGMAYDPDSEGSPDSVFLGPSAWECSGILLGTGDKSVEHTPPLPFSMYDIKSEGQPSAGGATTRPAVELPTAEVAAEDLEAATKAFGG